MQQQISSHNQVILHQFFKDNISAKALNPDGQPNGTFRTYTVLADGDNLTFRDCSFINDAGPGEVAGQAIALYLDGDNITLENCILKGHQDTLFLAPLPEKEIIPGGFLGPKQFTPRHRRTFHFKNCLIEGGVDFIFGGATAYFDNCEFKNVEPGYVFAPSTPKDVEVGFVARNCRFTASGQVPKHSCYIARPWRNHGMVQLISCELGEHIHPDGWDDWGKTEAHETIRFSEEGSYGPGASSHRPSYVKIK